MNEDDLRLTLSALGIRVEGRNEQRARNRVWLNFRCPIAPFHPSHNYREDGNPSAGAVTDVRGRASRWSCHACKSHGTLFDLAHELAKHPISGIDYAKVAEDIIDIEHRGMADVKFGQDLLFDPPPEPLIEEAYEGLWPDAWAVPVARNYLRSRSISEETATKLGLLYDGQYNRIMFPVRNDRNELFGWSGRAVGDNRVKVLDYEGLPKRNLMLGQERWREGKPLIVVEGLFAYARLVELGVEEFANVGALLGSEMTEEKAEIIRDFGERTFLMVDNDPAGDACLFGPLRADGSREAGRGAVHLLKGHVPVFVPEYPEGKTDPDELTLDEVKAMMTCPLYSLIENNS